MFDLPLLVARSGSDTATGCATAPYTWPKGAVIDIVRFFEIARRLPSVGERILEKTVAKAIRKFCIARKGRYPLTAGWARQASNNRFPAELTRPGPRRRRRAERSVGARHRRSPSGCWPAGTSGCLTALGASRPLPQALARGSYLIA